MDYDEIVFIGFVIDTAPKRSADGSETWPGLSDPAHDIVARCNLLSAAAVAAFERLPPASPHRKTLHLFMVPEFYFRGVRGAYAIEEVRRAIEHLQDIASMKPGDWMFEFGTIVGDLAPGDPFMPGWICNFALAQVSGPVPSGFDGAVAVAREIKSGIAFIAAEARPGAALLGAVAPPPPAMPIPDGGRQRAAYDRAGLFTLAGLTWAIDPAPDRREWPFLQPPQLPGDAQVQVQLVPSCGAGVDERAIVVREGGYVFRVDGMGAQAQASLFRVGASLEEIAPAACAPFAIDEVPIGRPPTKKVPVSEIFAGGAGSIFIFPPVPVPPVEAVRGRTDTYTWPASARPEYSLTFYLVWDENDVLRTALCRIRSREKDFRDHKYVLTLAKDMDFITHGPEPEPGSFLIELRPGGDGYDNAVFADIRVPGFRFQGEVMQFMHDRRSPKPLQKIW